MGATVEWAPYSITITGAPAPHLGLLRWRASERPSKRSASCMKAYLLQSELAGGASPGEAVVGSGKCITHAPCEARPAEAQQQRVRERTGPSRDELVGVDHDCNDIPDAAMTLAVAALFAKGPTRIRNVYNWRVKVISFSASPRPSVPCVADNSGYSGGVLRPEAFPSSTNWSVRHVMHCPNLMCCRPLFATDVFATCALPA